MRNLIDADFLHADDEGYLHFDDRISAPAAHAELLLAADVRHSIERMARVEPPSIEVATIDALAAPQNEAPAETPSPPVTPQ